MVSRIYIIHNAALFYYCYSQWFFCSTLIVDTRIIEEQTLHCFTKVYNCDFIYLPSQEDLICA